MLYRLATGFTKVTLNFPHFINILISFMPMNNLPSQFPVATQVAVNLGVLGRDACVAWWWTVTGTCYRGL